VAELVDIQERCQEWLARLPGSLAYSATWEALEAICKLDLSELEAVAPPRGYGRD
jgi:hypothetical protein